MANYEKQFSTTSINTGGRNGKSSLEDGSFEVTIIPPGSKREGANPEELFALGYSACFHSALDAAKEQENVDNESIVTITVNLLSDPDAAADFKLAVEIEAGLEGMDIDDAQKLVEKAHTICPYSRAIENGHIDVTVKAVPYED